ncbi:MAG: molybdopterin-dependent oxidoreductase, partial [Thermocrispum sp.]
PSLLAGVVALAVLVVLVRLARAAEPQPGEESAGEDHSRRSVLLAGLAALGLAVVTGVAGRLLQAGRADVSASRARIRLPEPADPAPALPAGYRVKVPGISSFVSTQKDWDYYVIHTALNIPAIPAEEWALRIGGDVRNPMELTFADVLSRDLMERDLTLSCVSNSVGGRLTGNARWIGLSLGELLREAGVSGSSDQLLSRSTDGMTIGTPMETVLDGRDAMLVVGMNGEPLEPIHGFPARLLVPGLYGYTSATKWVIELEATRFDKVDAYWTARDWNPRGVVKTMSRIDTPRPFANLPSGEITVAGVAWAQHRGISAVQVRVDGGDWQETELSKAVSDDTWRQWHTTFKLRSGNHRFEARAVDGDGAVQEEKDVPPFPAGASGWHSVVTLVSA